VRSCCASYSDRDLLVESRVDTSATGTSHQPVDSGSTPFGSVSNVYDGGMSGLPRLARADRSSSKVRARITVAPRLSAVCGKVDRDDVAVELV